MLDVVTVSILSLSIFYNLDFVEALSEVGYFTGGHPTIFSIWLYHGGEFTKFPGRKYIKGKQTYIDLLDMDTFSVHDIDEMMEQLGYVDEGIPLYYHFKRPFSDLDFGLFALGSD